MHKLNLSRRDWPEKSHSIEEFQMTYSTWKLATDLKMRPSLLTFGFEKKMNHSTIFQNLGTSKTF